MLLGLFIFSSFAPPAYQVGDTVKDFKLKNVDGKMVSLADYQTAKGFIVVFTCNHCPYAKAYEQRIMDLDKTWSPKGYPVIAISANDPTTVPDDSYDNMVKRAKEKGYTFPYLFDQTQGVARDYGATRTPQVYVLQKSEKGMKVEYIGAIDDNTEDASAAKNHYVDDAVSSLLKGAPVAVPQTKAVGCTIKWKA